MQNTQPTRLNTPAIKKMIENDVVKDYMKDMEMKVKKDFKEKIVEPCPKCSGTGKNPSFPEDPFCLGCDGTGTWYIITFGLEDGEPFGYTEEYGVDFIKEYCKARREAHADLQLAGKVGEAAGIMPFALPKTLEIELQSRGMKPQDSWNAENIVEIANLVSREYPDFMCVNYKRF